MKRMPQQQRPLRMRGLILSIFFPVLMVVILSGNPKPITPTEVLSSIALVDSFRAIPSDNPFSETYEVWFRVPLDHTNPHSQYFPLRVYYSHNGFNKPMVVVIDGYTMYTSKANEITSIVDGNQITIEHRFFSQSRPLDSIPWSYLNIRQAAADAHLVISAFKPFYHGKWISTGISKSGQATIFHRRFYPADVNVSIPYVAPLNFSSEDERVYKFLDSVGTPECRKKIYDFQIQLFERKSEIMPLFKELSASKGWKFTMGFEKAYDLSVLEYSFAFWQWGFNCSSIPASSSTAKELFEHWLEVNPFSFFEENEVDKVRPFFYQAMTEIGMYGYRVKPFSRYLSDTANITFSFAMPRGHRAIFNASAMSDIDRWVEDSGSYMLYIYGQNDAWSATAVDPGRKTNAVKMVCPGGSHSSRIKDFPPELQDSIYKVLGRWLDLKLPANGYTNSSSGL